MGVANGEQFSLDYDPVTGLTYDALSKVGQHQLGGGLSYSGFGGEVKKSTNDLTGEISEGFDYEYDLTSYLKGRGNTASSDKQSSDTGLTELKMVASFGFLFTLTKTVNPTNISTSYERTEHESLINASKSEEKKQFNPNDY